MWIIKATRVVEGAQVTSPVTILYMEESKVKLGLDPDNLIACFPNYEEAKAAVREQSTLQCRYVHSLVLGQCELHVHECK